MPKSCVEAFLGKPTYAPLNKNLLFSDLLDFFTGLAVKLYLLLVQELNTKEINNIKNDFIT